MKLNKWICALVLALALCMMGSVALAVTNTMPAPVNGVITLTDDVDLNAYYAVTSDTILNLNGHTISRSASYPTESTAGNLTVFGPATLTINGPGTVNSADEDNHMSQIAVWAYNGGKVIINGGTFKGSSLNYVLNLRDNTGARSLLTAVLLVASWQARGMKKRMILPRASPSLVIKLLIM